MFWRKSLCLAQGFLNFCGPRGIDVIRCDPGAGAFALGLEPQNSQEAIRCECAKKQALLALAVINELASDSEMHSARRAVEIVDDQVGPILAKTVGEDPIVRRRSAKVENRVARRIHTADA